MLHSNLNNCYQVIDLVGVPVGVPSGRGVFYFLSLEISCSPIAYLTTPKIHQHYTYSPVIRMRVRTDIWSDKTRRTFPWISAILGNLQWNYPLHLSIQFIIKPSLDIEFLIIFYILFIYFIGCFIKWSIKTSI